jgi:CheY-like chemotaxis protein
VLVASAAPFGGPWMAEALDTAGAACRHEATLAGAEQAVNGGAWSFMLIDRGLGEGTVDLAARARARGIRTVALLEPRERRAFDRLQARGFDHFLVKPVRAGSLLAVLSAPSTLRRRPQPGATARRLPRALVAEDEAVNALLARAHLGRLGYAVAHVEDGAEAVAAFTEALANCDGFALVLLDLRLPGLDGFAVARRLRAVELEQQAPPTLIVALTANDGVAEKRAALDAGMDAFLGKPLDREALARLVADRPIAAAG